MADNDLIRKAALESNPIIRARYREKLQKAQSPEACLFRGVFPTGISYADRCHEVNGDYKKLAFLPFSTLELRFEKNCPEEFKSLITTHAAEIQAKRGEEYQVSESGQTVLLGGK